MSTWRQNPETGESYQVEDATPGAGTESGYQNPYAGPKKKVPEWSGPIPVGEPPTPPPAAPAAPALPPPTPPPPIAFNGSSFFNPTTAPYGFDQSQPGMREQFWNNNQNLWFQSPQLDWVDDQQSAFDNPWYGETWNQQNHGALSAPGAGEQYWEGIKGSANTPSAAQRTVNKGYSGPNHAEEAFGMAKANMPGSLQPQFDSYYDRMGQKAVGSANTQAAARGAYGSSSALNGVNSVATDVEAQRAKAGTDFSLADSQNQLNWHNSLGQMGRAADLSGVGAYDANIRGAASDLDRIKTYGDLAFDAQNAQEGRYKTQSDVAFGIDDAQRDRMGMGLETAFGSHEAHRNQLNDAFGAAGQAEDARNKRIGGLYDDLTGFSNDAMGFVMQNFDKLLSADSATLDSEIEAMLGQTADQRGWDQQTKDQIFRDVKAVLDYAKGKQAEGESASRSSPSSDAGLFTDTPSW